MRSAFVEVHAYTGAEQDGRSSESEEMLPTLQSLPDEPARQSSVERVFWLSLGITAGVVAPIAAYLLGRYHERERTTQIRLTNKDLVQERKGYQRQINAVADELQALVDDEIVILDDRARDAVKRALAKSTVRERWLD